MGLTDVNNINPYLQPNYKLSNNFGWNVGGVSGAGGSTGTYGTGRYTPADNLIDGISCSNSRGAVGCAEVAVSPFANGQCGYKEKAGFEPVLKHCYG